MGRIWLACLGLAGCQPFLGLDAPVLAPDGAAPDSNQVCIGSGLVSFCVTNNAVPTNAFDIAPGATFTIDPTIASLCLRTQLAGAPGGVSAGPLDRALGGTGGSAKGGAGGAGSLDTSPGTAGSGAQDSTGGGGGGGGGGGIIAIYSNVLSNKAVISPPPQ